MDPELLRTWPIWAIIVYLVIKDVLPMLSNMVLKLGELVVPQRTRLAQLKQAEEREIEARRVDLREREVIALEQIGKSLIMIDTRIQGQEKQLDLLTTGLVTANQALAVMLDRINRRREDYPTEPKQKGEHKDS